MPYVSVIVPVYNVAPYLRECLDSLVNQTLKDIEIICVDDGSTDNSPEILEEYKSKDNRMQIITQSNQGLSAARNTGVRFASGEYLYFIDSDDYIELFALEYLYHEAKEQDLDILCFDAVTVFESEAIKEEHKASVNAYSRKHEYTNVYSGEKLYVAMRNNGDYTPVVWLQFIKHEYYTCKKLAFYEGILHEDLLFSLQCILQAKQTSHRRKQLYFHRKRLGAITTGNYAAKRVHGHIVTLINIVNFVQSNRFSDEVEADLKNYLERFVRLVRNEYRALTEEEMEEFNPLSYQENFMAEVIINTFKDPAIGNLKKEIEEQNNLLYLKNNELQVMTTKIQQLENECLKEKQRTGRYQKQLQDMSNSYSFKAGRCLTWLPRKIRDCFRNK